jgi:hypothetical protein
MRFALSTSFKTARAMATRRAGLIQSPAAGITPGQWSFPMGHSGRSGRTQARFTGCCRAKTNGTKRRISIRRAVPIAYPNSRSPFGSFDMGGDVAQWNEAQYQAEFRLLTGGKWDTPPNLSAAVVRGFVSPPNDWYSTLGFRVASVPEPGSVVLGVIGLGGLLIFSKRFRFSLKPRSGDLCVAGGGAQRNPRI